MLRRKVKLRLAATVAAAVTAVGAGLAATTGSAGGPVNLGKYLHSPLNCSLSPTPQQLLAYKVPKAKKRYDITVMEVSLNGYYYQALAWGAAQAGKQAGVTVHLTAASGYTTPAQQLGQVENVLQRGTDGVVFAPVDFQGSIPAVQKFKAKHIPVVNVSTEVADPYVYTVMQDDYLMGKAAADAIHKLVPKGGPGIFMAGPANATWSRKRVNGFVDQVKAKYPNLKVAATPTSLVDPGEALTKFTDAVSANPDIKWLASAYYILPVPESLPAQYRGKIPYVTMGFEPTSVDALKKGWVATDLPVDPVWMGYVGVGTVVSLLNGQKQPKINCLPYPPLTKSDLSSSFAKHEIYPPSFKATTG
jgi:ribose transport system substrate-binding protein